MNNISNKLISILRCPKCKTKLTNTKEKLFCKKCKRKFKIDKNIINLMPNDR